MIESIVIILLLIVFFIILVCFCCCNYNTDNFSNLFKTNNKKVILHHHITHSAGTKLLDIVHKNNLKADWVTIDPKLSPSEVEKYLLNKNLDWMQIEGPLPDNLPWNSDKITFTTIIREPLSRAVAGDGFMNKFPEIKKGDYSRWVSEWKQMTDNYNTRWIANKWTGFSNSNVPELHPEDLKKAKDILDKFDLIILLEDLPEASITLKNKLGWEHWDMGSKKHKKSTEEKINDKKVFEQLKNQNKFDIELYNYAKKIKTKY